MTLDELKRTGKDGVYRADLDQWFIAGEEPPVATPKDEPIPSPEAPTIDPPAEAKKTTKLGKDHD